MLRLVGIAAALAAALCAVYLQVGSHEFVEFDDFDTIVGNPSLEGPLDFEAVLRHFSEARTGNWVPLTWLSLHVDRLLYAEDPAGYHLTNLFLHVVSALLLLTFLWRTTGSLGCSAFVAAGWALHPMRVESVAWASERKDVLAGVFFMGTLLSYAYYAQLPVSRLRYAAVVGCLALGLLAKPMLVSLPLLLLLLDYWPLRRFDPWGRDGWRRAKQLAIEKLPLVALALLAAAVAWLAQDSEGAMRFGDRIDLGERLRNASLSYVVYLRQSFWPTDLAFFYPHPREAVSLTQAGACVLLISLVTAMVVRLCRRQRQLLVGWSWYLITLVPVIGFIQIGLQARADRYTYLPSIGLWLMLAWTVSDLIGSRRALRAVVPVIATAALLALALLSYGQVQTWRDSTALFEHAVSIDGSNYLAHQKLGLERERKGDEVRAEQHYRRSIEVAPDWAPGQLALAELLVRKGELEAALPHYRRGTELAPGSGDVWTKLGLVEYRLEELEAAEQHLRRGLELGIVAPVLRVTLARLAEDEGRFTEAAAYYRSALEEFPGHSAASAGLIALLLRCKDPAPCDPREAIEIGERALATGGRQPAALHAGLASAYERVGRRDEAVAEAARAARIAEGRGDEELEAYRAQLRRYLATETPGASLP